jgi:Tfp pilus assembly protein PilF
MANGRRFEVEMNRIEILKGFLKENANDSFSRYALALEYAKLGQNDDAIHEFETVKERDPDYVATYFQLGQLYQKLGQSHAAEKTFRTGITVAAKIGDEHTRSELEGALEALL